jgi:hypothetical protein
MTIVDTRKRLTLELDTDYAHMVRADNYFRGRQPLAYLDPDVRRAIGDRLKPVSVNWCRLVVEAVEQRLDVEGFRSTAQPAIESDLWRIWQANGLDETSQQAHIDALVYGRAYVMVWAGDNPSTPRITVESPLQVITEADPATGVVVGALKRWQDLDKHARAIVFAPDEVIEYRSRSAYPDSVTFNTSIDAYEVVNAQRNPLGRVPVVPIVNRPRPLLRRGESELTDVMPLVDALSKLMTDMLTSAEYHAQPRRWVTGFGATAAGGRISEEQLAELKQKVKTEWEQARASKVWIADTSDAKFGQFPEAQLDNFIGAINMITRQLSAVAGLPPHYVALAAETTPASADAIRSAEASLVNRARRRQRSWGGSWEEVMRLALAIRDGIYPAALSDLETVWRSAEITSIAQAADAAVKLHAEGILDNQAVLERLDYSPQSITQITGGSND